MAGRGKSCPVHGAAVHLSPPTLARQRVRRRRHIKKPAPAPCFGTRAGLCFVVPPKFGEDALRPLSPLTGEISGGVSALRSAAVTSPSLREGSQPAAFLSGARNSENQCGFSAVYIIYMRNVRKSQQISGVICLRPYCGCSSRPFQPWRKLPRPLRNRLL